MNITQSSCTESTEAMYGIVGSTHAAGTEILKTSIKDPLLRVLLVVQLRGSATKRVMRRLS
jgi:hypothetical protein